MENNSWYCWLWYCYCVSNNNLPE